MNPLEVQRELHDKSILVFTPLEFQRLFRLSPKQSFNLLAYHTKRGLFVRLKNGLYALSTKAPPVYLVANKLYQPSYISFEYALSYYHLIPETVYTITSATTKPTREFEALGKIYRYYKIKKGAFAGYEPRKIDEVTIFIAEPEKALVDYLYFVNLKKKRLNRRLVTENLHKRKVIEYAKLFERESLFGLVKEVL